MLRVTSSLSQAPHAPYSSGYRSPLREPSKQCRKTVKKPSASSQIQTKTPFSESPCIWNTLFAKSRPTVIISDMTTLLFVDHCRPTLAHRCRRGAVLHQNPLPFPIYPLNSRIKIKTIAAKFHPEARIISNSLRPGRTNADTPTLPNHRG